MADRREILHSIAIVQVFDFTRIQACSWLGKETQSQRTEVECSFLPVHCVLFSKLALLP